MTITGTLKAHPLCEEIVRFLLDNEHAMDTARGIAAWWVQSDEMAVQAALDQLIACRVIALYQFTSGVLYGLTRDQEIRAWLRGVYGARTHYDGVRRLADDILLSPDQTESQS